MPKNSRHLPERPEPGLVEWFRPGEQDRVEQVLADVRTFGVSRLRTGFSWADYHAPGGQAWYDWLVPRLAREVEVLPCVHYTPPSLGMIATSASPPRDPKAYADFLDTIITRLGRHFEWVELWNEPNNLSDWDWRLDPDWMIFCSMVGGAAYWARQRGKKTLLGGPCPTDLNWLDLIGRRGVLACCDAVGVHGFPGTWEFDGEDWPSTIAGVRSVVERYQSEAEVWITEAGFSTWKHDERGQLNAFLRALESPVERLYWYSVHDLHPDLPTQDGLHSDIRHYHMGLKRCDGSPKLLARLWESGGLVGVRRAALWSGSPPSRGHVLVTGGAGFLGSNLADRLLEQGQPVVLLDNLSRPEVEHNYEWLRSRHGDRVILELADVRDRFALRRVLETASSVYHLAAQTSPAASLANPLDDFDINARGSLLLLEELRALPAPPPLVFTSSMQVPDRPGGCSKGAAEQYMIDYARSFGLQIVVLRLSCVYGPRQHDDETHNPVGHDLKQALLGSPRSESGVLDAVEDLLHVDDAVEALLVAQRLHRRLSGQAFSIGGGPEHADSLRECLGRLADRSGQGSVIEARPPGTRGPWPLVCEIPRFQARTDWTPQVSAELGLESLRRWYEKGRPEPVSALANPEIAS